MTDIARLGLSVGYQDADQATLALNRMTAAGKKAEDMAIGVGASADRAAKVIAQEAAVSERAAKAIDKLGAANANVARRWETHEEVCARLGIKIKETANAADKAAQSVINQGEAAAEAAEKIADQGNEVEKAAAKTERASLAAQGFAVALSKVRQVLVGFVFNAITVAVGVLIAELAKLVDWASWAKSALYGLADAVEVIAPYAVLAAGGLALLYAPAILAGLWALTVGILGVVQALGAMVLAFAVANPGAAFILALTGIVVAANVFRDEITQIFGFDVVDIVKRAANFVINSFFAAFEDIKFVWNNFGDIMGAAVIGGVNIAIRAIDGLIQKATQGIDRILEYINPVLEAAGMEEIKPLSGNFKLNELPNPYADRVAAANDAHRAIIEAIMGRDSIGDFGDAISKGASAAADKLRDLAAGLGETEKAKKSAKTEAEKLAEKYDRIVAGAEAFIAAQRVEADVIGMTEEAANRLRYEQDMLNRAANDNIKLTATQRMEIAGLAEQMAAAEASTNRLRDAFELAKDITRGFFSDLRSGLEQGKGFWKSFGDAALNALDKIVDKLLNDVLDALFTVNGAGSGGGGIFGFLGNLFGLGAKADPWAGMRTAGFAEGGYTGAGAATQAAGIVHAGEFVFSKRAVDRIGVDYLAQLHNAAKGYQAGGLVSRLHAPANRNMRGFEAGGYVPAAPRRASGADATQVVRFEMHVTVSGNGDKELMERVRKGTELQMEEGLKLFSRNVLPGRVNEISQNPRQVG